MEDLKTVLERDLEGVFTTSEFLTKYKLIKTYKEQSNIAMKIGKKIAVVGEDNIAINAARLALRLGAKVHVVYKKSKEELLAKADEIQLAKEEGVIFDFLTKPIEIITNEDEQVIGMKCVELKLGEPDVSGKRKLEEPKDSRYIIDFDTIVISADT